MEEIMGRLARRFDLFMDKFVLTGEPRFLTIALEADRLWLRCRDQLGGVS